MIQSLKQFTFVNFKLKRYETKKILHFQNQYIYRYVVKVENDILKLL